MRVNGFCGFSTQCLKPVRVLSLFDGIGTGLLVLDKLGLKVDAYFSSEVDEKALSVLKYQFGNRITHLGCVTELTETQLSPLRIDLLVGGSPCSDLSLVNPRRRGLHGKLLTCDSVDVM